MMRLVRWNNILKISLSLLFIAEAMSCKKLYTPPAITAPGSYLVVDGSISSGDSTIIKLSYTVKIADSARSKPETNASITIEGSQGGTYPLISKGNGSYVSAPLNLSASQNYRLKITTSNGKQYASDFVPLKNSPPIDSVNYQFKTDGITRGLQINVNTHDASNSTRYYRWEYIETYIIESPYYSHWIVVNHDSTKKRTPDQQIFECWPSDTSSNLVLGSSAKLSKDVISQQALVTVPNTSEKLRFRYSILVKQYALTTDAYNYYVLLQKNTEQLGSIFDAQPSEITGNVHSLSNPAEPVIGYVTAGAVAQSRIFIDKSQLTGNFTPQTPYESCYLDTLLYQHYIALKAGGGFIQYEVTDLIYTGIQIPVDSVGSYPTGGFTAAFPQCVDCTLRGTNKQPIFWK